MTKAHVWKQITNKGKYVVFCAVIAAGVGFGIVKMTRSDSKARQVKLGWTTEQVRSAIGEPNMIGSEFSSMMGGVGSHVGEDSWCYYRNDWFSRKSNSAPAIEAFIVFYQGRVCGIATGDKETGERPDYIEKSPEFARMEAELQRANAKEMEEEEKSLRGD